MDLKGRRVGSVLEGDRGEVPPASDGEGKGRGVVQRREVSNLVDSDFWMGVDSFDVDLDWSDSREEKFGEEVFYELMMGWDFQSVRDEREEEG